jgi:phosphatidylserine/phosphatidylglycerophosphate/cardiolipin synthase-like enzyme
MAQSIALKVYDNGDHTALVWLPSGPAQIPGCRGFIIRKQRNGTASVLRGSVSFTEGEVFDPMKPWRFPLQRYLWWDYYVRPGDVVQYSVVPVVGPDQEHLQLDDAHASPLSAPLTVKGQSSAHVSAYFNKGIVAAQWVSKALDQLPAGSKIADLAATPGNDLRNRLSGLLRPQLLQLLADAKAAGGQVFAALYELNDPELIAALTALGASCHLILANGAKVPDENADVRDHLKTTTQVDVQDRLVSSSHFAHNKFVVFCDSAGQPQKVLTGSTNWTSSGLCTQANNGLIIEDAAVAADFLAAWQRLKAAGNAYPKALVDGNDHANSHAVDGGTMTPWFVKTSAQQDLTAARARINGAKDGILFLFFNPGQFQQDPARRTLLQDIMDRGRDATSAHYDAGLYIRGVVNQDIPLLTTAAAAAAAPAGGPAPAAPAGMTMTPPPNQPKPVQLYESGKQKAQGLGHQVLVPGNVKSKFHDWEKELLGASLVNVHSKVIVIDPFGDKPVLMTGSHNLGYKASHANDDNLLIVENNAPLAIAYALNIIAIFQTYRWNHYVELHRQDPNAWHGPKDTDTWQTSYLSGDSLRELQFWMG